MLNVFAQTLGIALLVAAAVGVAYTVTAVALMRRFASEIASTMSAFPAVTIMKPLHGAEPNLYENLASFCDQDYPGRVQLLFGVQDPGDAAIAIVERVVVDRPRCDIQLEVAPLLVGGRHFGDDLPRRGCRVEGVGLLHEQAAVDRAHVEPVASRRRRLEYPKVLLRSQRGQHAYQIRALVFPEDQGSDIRAIDNTVHYREVELWVVRRDGVDDRFLRMPVGDELIALSGALEKVQSVAYARRRAEELARSARQELECLPRSECRSILELLTEWAVRREK